MPARGMRTTRALVCAALFTAALTAPGAADEIADFYRGRNMDLQIGSGAGGGNDLWGRVVGRHIGRHIPGGPTIVPKNMPAAGSLALANFLYNAAPQDGSVIGMILRGIPFEPLFEGQGVQFDPLKFNYVGSPSRDLSNCAVWHTHPAKTAKDMFERETVFGSTGAGNESHIFPLILEKLIGMKARIIKGYKGSQDMLLAVEKRELDGICIGTESLRRSSQFQSGNIRIILQMATEKDPSLGDLPLVTDFAKTPADRAALDLIFARVDLGRPFVAPPGVPAARVQALRTAFMATTADSEFRKEAEKLGFEINATPGDKLEALVRNAYRTPKDVVKRTAELLAQ
jgi:tripartite-type tricarboxylate transporter receptor subunit TctC